MNQPSEDVKNIVRYAGLDLTLKFISTDIY